ncbi:MAG: serine hydrolase domain-containing protein [Planctomycetota bacterium]|jgi:CubicO group peptidase (beta-lactamase class C family)
MRTSVILILLLASAVHAQPDTTGLPDKYRELLGAWASDSGPGGYIGVYHHGRDAAEEIVFGLADIEDARPMTTRTPVYVASVAKTFTAAAAVHAAGAGVLDLDASISGLFPELGRAYGSVTPRQLIQHRSGVPDIYDTVIACDLPLSALSSNAAAVELLLKFPAPSFGPGSQFLYSNSGYVLLAEVIERASGADLASYAREHIFAPAGMSEAHYLGEEPPLARARAYSRSAAGWSPREVQTGTRGPGGLYLSGHDLLQFERASRRGIIEERTALGRADGPNNPRVGRYGAGWMHQRVGDHRVIRHPGGAFGFGADLLRFPDEGLSIIVLLNTDATDVTDLSEAVARLELGERFRPRPKTEASFLTPEQRRRFGRIWRETASGRLWIVTDKRDHFVLATLGDLKLRMVPVAADRLEAEDGQTPFTLLVDGQKLIVQYDDGSTTALEPVPFPPSTRAEAAEVAGQYVSPTLGATIELAVTTGGMVRLVQHDPILELPPFIPLNRDVLLCDRGAQIDLRRDAQGRIIGLMMSANRAWGIEFERVGS